MTCRTRQSAGLVAAVLLAWLLAMSAHAGGAETKLRSGDIVLVILPGETSVSKEYQIDPIGQILLPEVGPVTIAGATVEGATQTIRKQLSKAFRDLDRLRVALKERRLIVKVGGYVRNPGTVNLTGDAGIQSALTAAGGLAQGAQLDRLILRRAGRDTVFNYKKYLDSGDRSAIPELLPLDEIFVPSSPVTGNVQVEFDGRTLSQAGDGGEERNSIKIFGEVAHPAVYAYKPGATLVDMLLRAGGVTRYATVEQIKLINKDQPVLFNLQAYLDTGNKSLLPELMPGATIFVPRQTEEIRAGARTVYVMGEVAKPGAYDTKAEATFIDILANAGGPTRFAETRQMRIMRAGGTVDLFDLVLFSEGKVKTLPVIRPGDSIFVPEKVEHNEPSWLKVPPTRAIHIIGAVNKPGRYEWASEMSLFDLLANAGGPHARADIANIQIMRHENDTASAIKFDLQKFISNGGALASVPKLHAGYVIMVPELPIDPNDNKSLWIRQTPERSIYIMGAVGRPGRYAFNKTLAFLDILAAADGPNQHADLRNVRVSHRHRGGSIVTGVNLARYFATGDDGILPKVRPGDVIFVPERNKEWLDDPKETTVRVLGAVHKPGRYRFSDEMTILDLLAEAGGPIPAALQSRILVVNMGLTERSSQFDLLSFAKTGDTRMLPVVRSGDLVYVPDQGQSEVRQTLDFLKEVTGLVSGITSVWVGLNTSTTTTTTSK